MMDPVTVIVTALATGAAAGLTDSAKGAIKDTYDALKTLIKDKYRKVNLAILDEDPSSKARQEVVKEDLEKSKADEDDQLLQQAQQLIEAIRHQAPAAAKAAGIDIEELEAQSVFVRNVVSAGGIRLYRTRLKKDLVIEDFTAGDAGSKR
jgi:hypothetical protein